MVLLNHCFPVKNYSVEKFSTWSLGKCLRGAAFTHLHCPWFCPLWESCCPSLHTPLTFTKEEHLFIYILLPLSTNPCPPCTVPMVQVSCKTFSCYVRIALSSKSVPEDLHTLTLPSLHKGLVSSQVYWSSVWHALPQLHSYGVFWAMVHNPRHASQPRGLQWRVW